MSEREVFYSCSSCGYPLNLSSSHRTPSEECSKLTKKGFVPFACTDHSRFTQVDETNNSKLPQELNKSQSPPPKFSVPSFQRLKFETRSRAEQSTTMAYARSPIRTESTNRQRTDIKSSSGFNTYPAWKRKLRDNCHKRIRDGRNRLLWKMRLSDSAPDSKSLNHKELVRAALQEIVSDELKRIKDSSVTVCSDILDATSEMKDMIWEYDGIPDSYEGDCEDILLEMQNIFYDDLGAKPKPTGTESIASWEDEEEEYLIRSMHEYMQLNEEQASNETWCPCCKQGKLQENRNLIYCNLCELKLRKSDEVTLEFFISRLAEEHAEHLDRGCRSKPSFSMETVFDLTAVFITCSSCDTFEIVL